MPSCDRYEAPSEFGVLGGLIGIISYECIAEWVWYNTRVYKHLSCYAGKHLVSYGSKSLYMQLAHAFFGVAF